MSEQRIPFYKAEACGNDFLIVESQYMPADPTRLSRQLCDRHYGIGADGVEWVTANAAGSVRARLFNADGSEAEISGNGTRCVAVWAIETYGGSRVNVVTGAGDKECVLLRRSDNEFEFIVEMGAARVLGEKVVGGVRGWEISTGNPHFVQFVDEFLSGWQTGASRISTSPEFPQGTNVELVRVLGRNSLEFRIFERGAGETQSSGTGSCASAIAAIFSGRAVSPVEAHAPGGKQVVHWDGKDALLLEGPARLICQGEFFLTRSAN
jgi:diaminopimelate epimerase